MFNEGKRGANFIVHRKGAFYLSTNGKRQQLHKIILSGSNYLRHCHYQFIKPHGWQKASILAYTESISLCLKVTDSYSLRLHVTCFSSLLFSSSPSTKWHISSSHLILSSSSSRPPLVFHPHPSGIHRIFHFLHLSALLSSFQRRHKRSLHEKTAALFLSMFISVAAFGSQVPPQSLTSGSYLTLSWRNHTKLKAFLACWGACYQTLLPYKPKIRTSGSVASL